MKQNNNVPVVNIANALTVVRLVLVPVFIFVFLQDSTYHRWLAYIVFAVAAITDKLDGYYARSRNLVTDFGKLADSIADKALIISALILLSWHGYLWWWVTIVFIVRELGITLMRMMMRKIKVMAAGQGGKIKMVAQSFGIAGLLIPWQSIAFIEGPIAQTLIYISYALLAIALVFAVTSAIEYVQEAVRLSRSGNDDAR
ncbi:CDP-diacylglycerol--glycerol-3-phosphate 3-phosphatidyltransferase [Arcanobacterium bovis]|uniref:CDP-diacylglycerol--glycerol-3-phosphate 3-phosphatidyltransferase n=1 Tax=Arcanobacterium bovis TaxID=2529275 RepID=A0A4V2KR69_9ACTO|nr:CDP-diacylglycerol--glycerol-3-phosphate 3-phosphatidyltransferase [Arcanobacterium bovis]TBW22739.1 CDP-diacylglycerol--glycerol-3-phosphate 3-phosphatidyltransferase [Arcanobacterium bovis]